MTAANILASLVEALVGITFNTLLIWLLWRFLLKADLIETIDQRITINRRLYRHPD